MADGRRKPKNGWASNLSAIGDGGLSLRETSGRGSPPHTSASRRGKDVTSDDRPPKQYKSKGTKVDVDAVIVTMSPPSQSPPPQDITVSPQEFQDNYALTMMDLATSLNPQWTLTQRGTTGVHAMQLAVISETHAIIIDNQTTARIMEQGSSTPTRCRSMQGSISSRTRFLRPNNVVSSIC